MSLMKFLPYSTKTVLRKRILSRLNAIDTGGFGNWTFNGDGLGTIHNTDFLRDPAFEAAYQLGINTGSWGESRPKFRVYIATWAALQTKDVAGDYVECGVNRGGMARTQMELLDFKNSSKKYWLVDTYQGFPDEQKKLVSAGMDVDSYSDCYEAVVKTFAPFPNAHVIRGIVPEVLPEVKAEQICYLSLDMNCAEPEIAALEYFWPRLSRGAVVLMDDYTYTGFERQKVALDEFARSNNVVILGLPTGQGLLIKN